MTNLFAHYRTHASPNETEVHYPYYYSDPRDDDTSDDNGIRKPCFLLCVLNSLWIRLCILEQ